MHISLSNLLPGHNGLLGLALIISPINVLFMLILVENCSCTCAVVQWGRSRAGSNWVIINKSTFTTLARFKNGFSGSRPVIFKGR